MIKRERIRPERIFFEDNLADVLHIEVGNPVIQNEAKCKYTDYEIRLKINNNCLSLVRRRFSDFVWLKYELEKWSDTDVPHLPSKALLRQLPFRKDGGLFDEKFIEERRKDLETFVNK